MPIIEKLNTSQAFWLIYAHATDQRRKALRFDAFRQEDVCVLRCEDGRRCFLGALIPDDIYDKEMEGRTPERLLLDFPALAERFEGIDTEFLDQMVWIHDANEPEDWTGLLESVRINEGWPV